MRSLATSSGQCCYYQRQSVLNDLIQCVHNLTNSSLFTWNIFVSKNNNNARLYIIFTKKYASLTLIVNIVIHAVHELSSKRHCFCSHERVCTRSAFGYCESKWRMQRRNRSWNNNISAPCLESSVRWFGINNSTLLEKGASVHMKLDGSYGFPFSSLWGLPWASLLTANSIGCFWSTGKKKKKPLCLFMVFLWIWATLWGWSGKDCFSSWMMAEALLLVPPPPPLLLLLPLMKALCRRPGSGGPSGQSVLLGWRVPGWRYLSQKNLKITGWKWPNKIRRKPYIHT